MPGRNVVPLFWLREPRGDATLTNHIFSAAMLVIESPYNLLVPRFAMFVLR